MVIDKDVFGAFISGLCLIHCLAGPVLLVLGITTVGHAHLDEHAFHFTLLAPILFVAAWSIPRGLRAHHHKTPATLTVTGITCLVLGLLFIEISLLASVLGSMLLLTAHLNNRHLLLKGSKKSCQLQKRC